MTNRDEIIARGLAENIRDVMEHGPGLRWTRNTWVVAKDTEAGMVKLGGLGAMGVGEMWTQTDGDNYSHREDPTYADAPEQPYPGESFLDD